VVPERRRIKVSVTSARGHAVGATAGVDLRVFALNERRQRLRFHVRGDLYLTHSKTQGWKIFGYDLDRWVERGAMTEGGTA
jgi:hypothetical protein